MNIKHMLTPLLALLIVGCTTPSDSSLSSSISEALSSVSESSPPSSTSTSQSPSVTSSSSETIIKLEIDGEALNAFFDQDIYALLPKIYSNDYEFYDDSSIDYPIDIYIDLFDWTEADANAYETSLDALLAFDDEAGYIVLEGIYIYVFEDTITYATPTWSINIYTLPVSDPVTPGDTITATIDSQYSSAFTSPIADGSILSHLTITSGNTLTVSYAKNSSTVTTIFNNSSNEIRLYAGAGQGGAITISSTNNLIFISITIQASQNAGYSINGSSLITELVQKTTLASNTQSVTIQNAAISGQIRMISIELEYTLPA